MGRSVEEGRLVVPDSWPKWNKICGVNRRHGRGPCGLHAVIGMPTCRYHGSGGERNRELGQIRYLCWIITGGPQDVPIALACRVSLAVYAEAVLNQGKGTVDQQLKAALWLTKSLDSLE